MLEQQQIDGKEQQQIDGCAKKTFPAPLKVSCCTVFPLEGADAAVFPNNVIFVKGSYILERDEHLEAQKPR